MVTIATQSDVQSLYDAGLIHPEQSFDISRDITFVAHSAAGNLTGMLCLRPMFYAHSLSLLRESRYVANALWRQAEILAREAGVHGTLFQIHRDNARMIAFAREMGCVVEPDSDLYRYDILHPRSRPSKGPR